MSEKTHICQCGSDVFVPMKTIKTRGTTVRFSEIWCCVTCGRPVKVGPNEFVEAIDEKSS